MHEDYFDELGIRIKKLKSEINSLENFRNSLIKEINSLKTDKEESLRTVQTQIDEELKRSHDLIKKIKTETDEKISAQKSRLESIEKRELKLKKDELNLIKKIKTAEIERNEINGLRKGLIALRKDCDNKLSTLNDLSKKIDAKQIKIIEQEDILNERIKTFEKTQDKEKTKLQIDRNKFDKKEKLLESKFNALKIREDFVKLNQREIEEDKKLIADQWQQISNAKL